MNTEVAMQDWDVIEEVGGTKAMQRLMSRFYDRLFDDVMIGFFFVNSDKEALIRSQIDYVHAHLGGRHGDYSGPSIRRAHAELPILAGHFDRRHQILREVLEEFDVPERVQKAWLQLDRSMRSMVLKQGKDVRQQS